MRKWADHVRFPSPVFTCRGGVHVTSARGFKAWAIRIAHRIEVEIVDQGGKPLRIFMMPTKAGQQGMRLSRKPVRRKPVDDRPSGCASLVRKQPVRMTANDTGFV